MRIEVRDSVERVPKEWDALAPRRQVGLETAHLRAVERSRINGIEPYYLLAYEDGELAGIAYSFLIEMDFAFLQKDLPPDAFRALRGWHPSFLKARLLECGFLSGLGTAIAARDGMLPRVCRAVVPEMERIARDARADMILLRDVPFGDRADYAGFAESGFQPLLGFPVAKMPLRWSSFDEYLQALKCSTRKRVKRGLARRSHQLEYDVIPRFGSHAARLADLWRQTHRRAADYSHEELTEAFFVEIDRQLGDRSQVMAIKHDGRIVGFSLCLLGDEEYFTAHAGFDYQVKTDHNLHFLLSMAELDDALARRMRTINDGVTTYDVKFKYGFEAVPQVYFVKHTDTRLTPVIARKLQEGMPQPENAHRPFHDQDLSGRVDLKALASELAAPAPGADLIDTAQKARLFERANEARLAGLYGFFPPFESPQTPIVRRDGRPLIMLGSNAYLGLGTHPEVVAAARAAVEKYGTGCSGSPFLNGTLDIHVDLARSLAAFMQKEDAILCSTGYQTNLGVVAALVGEGDVVIMDRLDHASLVDGARLSHAEVVRFRHNDIDSLERALQQSQGRRRLVVVDSVFSMEGTVANLRAIVRLSKRYGARVMVDEAHAIGVLGPGGRGAAELQGVLADVDIVMGTFSKSFASIGGFVVSEAKTIDYLRHAVRSHMFSASLPPAAVAATRAALEIIKREPERRARVLGNAQYMAQRLQEQGYDAPLRGTAIVPVHCGHELLAFGLYKKLLDEGVFVNPVASPAVAHGCELLRTSYMATHEKETLDRAASVFARLRSDAFPRRARLVAVRRAAAPIPVQPLVLLPLASRGSFRRYWIAESDGALLHVPGFTHLEIGQPVDCGLSFGKERVIVQSRGHIVAKSLLPRPGRVSGVDVELLPSEARTRELIERFASGEDTLPIARHCWRYHAGLTVEYAVEGGSEPFELDDISLEGAAIRSAHQPLLGARILLRLRTPDGSAVELPSEVRWRRDGEAPAFGVRFDLSGATQRLRVKELIGNIKAAIADPAAVPMVH